MTTFVPEKLDLDDLRSKLEERFGELPPVGYVRGKTALHGAVVKLLECSALEAEQVVDTLETRGLIRYQGDPADELDTLESRWLLGAR